MHNTLKLADEASDVPFGCIPSVDPMDSSAVQTQQALPTPMAMGGRCVGVTTAGLCSELNMQSETLLPQQRGDETLAQQYWFAEELLSQNPVVPTHLQSSSSGVASGVRCDSSSSSGVTGTVELRRQQGPGQRGAPHTGLPVAAAPQPMAFSIFSDEEGSSSRNSKEEPIDSKAKRKQRIGNHQQQEHSAFQSTENIPKVPSDVPVKSNFTVQVPVLLSTVIVHSNRGGKPPPLSDLKEAETVPVSPQKRLRKEIAAGIAAGTQQSLEPIDEHSRETAHNRSRKS
jgi:hypothetical protein